MGIDTETDCFIFEVIDLVQMVEQEVADDEEVTVAAVEVVLVDGDLALVGVCLV